MPSTSTFRATLHASTLRELEHHSAFLERHIGPNDAEIAHMLRAIGHDSLDAMTDAIVPASIKSPTPLALPDAMAKSRRWRRSRHRRRRTRSCAASSAKATTARTRRTSSCAIS
jgi:hypothetical protein